MRFFWFHPASHGVASVQGTLLSVAVHAAFLGAAAYSTGPSSRLLEFRRAPDQLYYLPPPDRTPGRAATIEHLQYVELGTGRPAAAADAPDRTAAGQPDATHDGRRGGVSGDEAREQLQAAPLESQDSVYSVLSLAESATRVEGSAAPVYPADMLAQGIEGAVRTRYVIDTTGRADSAAFEVLSASHEAFERSVRAAVPGMRFSPAVTSGRKVRQVVEQEFRFRIALPTPVGAAAEHTSAIPVP